MGRNGPGGCMDRCTFVCGEVNVSLQDGVERRWLGGESTNFFSGHWKFTIQIEPEQWNLGDKKTGFSDSFSEKQGLVRCRD